MRLDESKAIYFERPEDFYTWLERNHEDESEVFVGYYKKHTGKQTMTWSQAVDQALCFGWIDGVLHRVDDERHVQRFTPRKIGSNWSKVNVDKMARLEEQGLVAPAGRRAFQARTDEKTGIYSFEQADAGLSPEFQRELDADESAREFLDVQPAWYRRSAFHWVMSAKREETRLRRLALLIEDSSGARRLRQFDRAQATPVERADG